MSSHEAHTITLGCVYAHDKIITLKGTFNVYIIHTHTSNNNHLDPRIIALHMYDCYYISRYAYITGIIYHHCSYSFVMIEPASEVELSRF